MSQKGQNYAFTAFTQLDFNIRAFPGLKSRETGEGGGRGERGRKRLIQSKKEVVKQNNGQRPSSRDLEHQHQEPFTLQACPRNLLACFDLARAELVKYTRQIWHSSPENSIVGKHFEASNTPETTIGKCTQHMAEFAHDSGREP